MAQLSANGPKVGRIGDGVFRVEHDGGFDLVYVAGEPERPWAFWNGRVYQGPFDEVPSALTGLVGSAGRSDAPQAIAAPMPAKVLKVLVAAGAAVKKGETLIVLEAMKMELPLRAPADATVAAVRCREGDLVQPDTVLVVLNDLV